MQDYKFWGTYGKLHFAYDVQHITPDFLEAIGDLALSLPEVRPIPTRWGHGRGVRILIPHGHVLTDWAVNQLPLATIRSKYFSEITDLGDSTEACANYLHDALEYKAPWVLSAFCLFVSKVAQDIADFSLSPLYRQLSMLPAYAKFGVNTPAAAFFSMIGVGAREVAILLAKHYHDQHPDARFNFARMLDWLLALEPEEVVQWFQAEAGRGLAGYVPRLFSFLDSIRSQEQTLDDILPVDIEVAGWRFYRGPEVLSQLIVGDEVRLKPDPLNPWDPYAVEVFDLRGAKLGFIPKSYSRAVQTHLISEQPLICRIVQIDSSLVYRPVKLRLESIVLR